MYALLIVQFYFCHTDFVESLMIKSVYTCIPAVQSLKYRMSSKIQLNMLYAMCGTMMVWTCCW